MIRSVTMGEEWVTGVGCSTAAPRNLDGSPGAD